MRFLKVLFWLLLGGLVAAFVIYNGDVRINLHLWGGLVADVSLPLLLMLVFLLGLLPPLIALQALRWRTRQRLAGLERALHDLRNMSPAAEPTLVAPETTASGARSSPEASPL